MEYIILGIALFALFNIYLVRCMLEDRKRIRAFEKGLHDNYGQPSTKKYPEGRIETIAGHFSRKKVEYCIDDITWNDLDMNRIFRSMDFTLSAAGEESLYTLLRCPSQSEEELLERERLIEYFMEHESERVQMQMFFAKVGRTGKYSIYDYIEYMDNLANRSNRNHYAMIGFMIAAGLLSFYNIGYGLFILCVLLCFNIITYFKEKKDIDPYITTFAYFLRVFKVADKIKAYDIPILKEQLKEIGECRKKFRKFIRFSSLLTHQNSMSGNPLEIILDYLRMALHLNIIKFNSMLREAKENKEEILRIIEIMGYIESMISIGAYRKSLPYYTLPVFYKEQNSTCNNELIGEELFHPLITNPVSNSVHLRKGMLLTGSNASGKSTFLKTIAIAQIEAQSIHTVAAKSYQSGLYRVFTSMALRDDLAASNSYFIVEIKSLKRIIDNIDSTQNKIMCFVDEVLRGTNTVERIAASTEILRSLNQSGTFSFAATHDIELTTLLEDSYENYHFEEIIEENDVKFNYQLCKGKATSRNAIRLLGVLGYEESIIKKAEKRAECFMKDGEWIK